MLLVANGTTPTNSSRDHGDTPENINGEDPRSLKEETHKPTHTHTNRLTQHNIIIDILTVTDTGDNQTFCYKLADR